jgi:hypothetical protein
MVSFNVVSLFTKGPIMEAISLLDPHFEDILRVFCHVLTSYFTFSSRIYECNNGVAMGSPPTPVITSFFTKDFEEVALD